MTSPISFRLWTIVAMLFNAVASSNGQLEFFLQEEQAKGTLIVDLPTELNYHNEKRRFQIVEQALMLGKSSTSTTKQWVEIDDKTGKMTQNERIDREQLCGDEKKCYILVKVVIKPHKYFELVEVWLYINDVNDNAPLFPTNLINFNVGETEPKGYSISLDRFQAVDTDEDEHATVSYTLLPKNSEYFKLIHYVDHNNVSHLSIRLKKMLDYEMKRVHRLRLQARDTGASPHLSECSIRIHVLDANDNGPIFEKAIYHANVSENMLPGHVIARVTATDRDNGRRGNVHYYVKNGDNKSGDEVTATPSKYPVEVNKNTGTVVLSGRLDYKLHDGLKIVVEAIDGDDVNPRSGITILELHVSDVNDHAPTINVNYIVEHEGDTAFISESEPSRTFMAHVTTDDEDKGRNGHVTLFVETVVPGTEAVGNITESGYFILVNSNLLATGTDLNREIRDTYDVIITACDKGISAKCSTYHIRVVVLDENEFTPKFQHGDVTLQLSEDTEVGTSIFTASASDMDYVNMPAWMLSEGKVEPSTNGVVTYGLTLAKIDDVTNDVDGLPFSIDLGSGKITLIRPLDFESRTTWECVITARDGGRPRALQSRSKLLINVEDVNDNKPIFMTPNLDNFTVYASTVESSPLFITLKAVDFDEGQQETLVYSFKIVKRGNRNINNEDLDVFNLDPSGEFSLKSNPEIGLYTTKIYVSDNGSPPLKTEMTMYVGVIDKPIPVMVNNRKHQFGNDVMGDDVTPATWLLAVIGGGGAVFLVIVVVALVFLIRRKKGIRKESEVSGSTPMVSEGRSFNDEMSTMSRGGSRPTTLDKPRRKSENNIYRPSSRKTSLSHSQSCRLCDAPNSPGSMQRYIEQQTDKFSINSNPVVYSSLMRTHGRHTSHDDVVAYVTDSTPEDFTSMRDQCTEMCKKYGHSDACWMPASEIPLLTPQPPLSPSETKLSWQPSQKSRRKDSGCSVDTTLSAISYYKISSQRRHNLECAEAAAKSRAAQHHSDASSMMSSATSSGTSSGAASSGAPWSQRSTSFNQRAPSHKAVKKSNSDSGFDLNSFSMSRRRKEAISSLSTQC